MKLPISFKNRFSTAVFSSLAFLAATANSFALGSMRPADPNAPQPPAWAQMMPILVMFGVFYFLLIRPQMRQRKNRDAMLAELKKGDKIVTNGGLIATVVNVGPTVLEVKLNEETKVKIQRSAVAEILKDNPGADAPPANT